MTAAISFVVATGLRPVPGAIVGISIALFMLTAGAFISRGSGGGK